MTTTLPRIWLLTLLCLHIGIAGGRRSKYASKIYRLSTEQKMAVIGTHNFLRSREPARAMEEMVWDEGLADLAADWAGRCMAIHRTGMERSRSNTSYAFVGENMWWSNEESLRDMRPVIRDFYNEKRDYTFANRSCTRGKLCGHYTAVVWQSSCAVGCAAARCDKILFGLNIKKGHVIVCNYGPGGNRLAQWPYKIGPKCADCPGACTRDRLCLSSCANGPRVTPLPLIRLQDYAAPLPTAAATVLGPGVALHLPLPLPPTITRSVSPSRPSPQRLPASNLISRPQDTARFFRAFRKFRGTKAAPRTCADSEPRCDLWRLKGECERNPAYMTTNCAFSCRTCHSPRG